MNAAILDVIGLTTSFRTSAGEVTPVRDVDLQIGPGETLALVGESGSGKTVTGLSCLRLLPPESSRIGAGQILFRGADGAVQDLAKLDEEAMRQLRGNRIAMVFQEPMTSLNPVFSIGEQIAEPLRIHFGLSTRDAAKAAVQALASVGIPDAAAQAGRYPHQFSGGQRQRAVIAMALACRPALLVADEPTTALDVTIQAQILDLLRQRQRELGMSMLFVSHNLGVVADIAQRVAVMYAGRIVESGKVRDLLRQPRHPYTIGLIAAMPRIGRAAGMRARGESLPAIPGNVPSLRALPPGCAFAPRCTHATDRCRSEVPPAEDIDDSHRISCFHWQDLA
jgi:peptide/nickel transport system ATP-binding protein